MYRIVEIFVSLLEESVDVWRPVQAVRIQGNVYRILPKPPELKDEKWEFEPGDVVVCEEIESSDGPILAATKRASQERLL